MRGGIWSAWWLVVEERFQGLNGRCLCLQDKECDGSVCGSSARERDAIAMLQKTKRNFYCERSVDGEICRDVRSGASTGRESQGQRTRFLFLLHAAPHFRSLSRRGEIWIRAYCYYYRIRIIMRLCACWHPTIGWVKSPVCPVRRSIPY